MSAAPGGLLGRIARRRSRALTGFERRESSQNGEDGVIEEILRRTGAPREHFVEFGIGAGVQGNCVRLANTQGWSGLFMEADADAHDALAAKYAAVERVRTRREAVSPANVVAVLREEGVPPDLGVLSIDIDGNDWWVWRALGAHFRPRLMVIEYNATLGAQAALVRPELPDPWDATTYFGASIQALRRLGSELGYRLVHTDSAGVNAFFVPAELTGAFPAEDRVPLHGPGYELPPDPLGRPWVDLDRPA